MGSLPRLYFTLRTMSICNGDKQSVPTDPFEFAMPLLCQLDKRITYRTVLCQHRRQKIRIIHRQTQINGPDVIAPQLFQNRFRTEIQCPEIFPLK